MIFAHVLQTLLENITDEENGGRAILFSRKLIFCSFLVPAIQLPSDRNKHAMVNPYMYTKLAFYRNETYLFLNPTLNNIYFTFFMQVGFSTSRKHLVIFLKTYESVYMDLNLRDEYMWCKEVCTNLFARLTNVFKHAL